MSSSLAAFDGGGGGGGAAFFFFAAFLRVLDVDVEGDVSGGGAGEASSCAGAAAAALDDAGAASTKSRAMAAPVKFTPLTRFSSTPSAVAISALLGVVAPPVACTTA